ncbi:MAG: ATP-grasp domain-containing protein, partial [Oligoflexia bacterium]|nr:ATP-grasp domain-containing protein [Oligoflexia bacterium]
YHIKTVALFIEEECDALFVKQAHESVILSKINGIPYLDQELLLRTIKEYHVDAVWVGWGFLSEDVSFAKRIEENGIVWIGPSSESMALLGDKIAAKKVAFQADVPILPWSESGLKNVEEARIFAKKIGYPVIIKAANAGGGRGIRKVFCEEELEMQFNSAREETIRITKNDTLFMEAMVIKARHLEVQIVADYFGNVHTYGVRDCSVQRNNQKIIEETLPINIDAETIARMEEASKRLIKTSGYYNVGTVEYIYDLHREQPFFMEVNTRLQVEHPITEQLFGIDLVKLQLAVAFGYELPRERRETPRGFVIEVRLNAEDADKNFTPSPGPISLFVPPTGPGLRIDTGVSEGSIVPSCFDSMIAKIIAVASTREEAIARLVRALDELKIKIEGGTTNRAFLKAILQHPQYQKGGVATNFIEELLKEHKEIYKRNHWGEALIAVALHNYKENYQEEVANFLRKFDRPSLPQNLSKSSFYETGLNFQGQKYIFKIKQVLADYFHLSVNNSPTVVVHSRKKGNELLLTIMEKVHKIQLVLRGDVFQCEVDGIPYHIEKDSQGIVKSPSPSMVLMVKKAVGDYVVKGELILILEAMKMELPIVAMQDGVIEAIHVRKGEQVSAGQVLVHLKPSETGKESLQQVVPKGKGEEQLSLIHEEIYNWLHSSSHNDWPTLEREFKAIFLGFDYDLPIKNILERTLLLARENIQLEDSPYYLFKEILKLYVLIERFFSKVAIHEEGSARAHPFQEYLKHYFKRQHQKESGLPEKFITSLKEALISYSCNDSYSENHADNELSDDILYRMYISHAHLDQKNELLLATIFELQNFLCDLKAPLPDSEQVSLSNLLDEVSELARESENTKSLANAASHTRYQLIDKEFQRSVRRAKKEKVENLSSSMLGADATEEIIACDDSIVFELLKSIKSRLKIQRNTAFQLLAKRYFRDICGVSEEFNENFLNALLYRKFLAERTLVECDFLLVRENKVIDALKEYALDLALKRRSPRELIAFVIEESDSLEFFDRSRMDAISERMEKTFLPPDAWPLCTTLAFLSSESELAFRSYEVVTSPETALREILFRRNICPLKFREMNLDLYKNFELSLLERSEHLFVMLARAYENPKDERLLAFLEIPDVKLEFSSKKSIRRVVGFEEHLLTAAEAIRFQQSKRQKQAHWNRIIINMLPPVACHFERLGPYPSAITAEVKDLHLEKVVLKYRLKHASGRIDLRETRFENPSTPPVVVKSGIPSTESVRPLNSYEKKLIRSTQLGAYYPYALVTTLLNFENTKNNDFCEYEVLPEKESGEWKTIEVAGRPFGQNRSNIVFGIISNKLKDGSERLLQRVLILSDPSSNLCALAESECRAIIAAFDLAESLSLAIEWIPISSGARIDMESGTENLDWTASVLKRIINFTQNGGEVNIIVSGINVGAQSYWNAEATMLMHTRGVLIMTEQGSMLLTGKKALEFSGSVSGEDSLAIGGVEKIMGPNGEAQFQAKDIGAAYELLFKHYALSHAKRIATSDPSDRDVTLYPYDDPSKQMVKIGDILSGDLNPDRKRAFDIRQVMRSVIDQDHGHLERWARMENAETAVVFEARIGGFATGLLAIESRPLKRLGHIPNNGPESWTGGTLFPYSSKKIARALNAFSDRLPVVVLANLSGFDGSPESLREYQLEFGAEIGRAVVNFKGPIFFVVISRYHGGAYVVFSKALNSKIRVAAIHKTYASVIGGSAAAAVVFPGMVVEKTLNDSRIIFARNQLKSDPSFKEKDYEKLYQEVFSEYQVKVAEIFDQIHSIERAQRVGSVDDLIAANSLRPYLVKSLESAYGQSL